MSTDHGFDVSAVDVWTDSVDFTVDKERTIAYARATNDPIAAHLDGTYAPPVFAVVPAMQTMAATTMAVVPEGVRAKILHGEHDFHIRRPLLPGETVTVRAKPIGIAGKTSGVVVTTLIETTARDGDVINEQYFTGFFRGGEFDGRVGRNAPDHAMSTSTASSEPVAAIEQRFDEDQTFRYAEPAGDPMRIHLDDEAARAVGLPGIIIHGLCTIAFASHALAQECSPDDPTTLRRLAVRLSSPGRPGQRILTRAWELDGSADRRRLAFATSAPDAPNTYLITDGLAEFALPTHEEN